MTERDSNADPITGEPGSHPVGTGVGAAGGGATGAAIGTAVGGPIGGVVGAIAGAVAGGLGGKGVAELIDPTTEDTYWRERHGSQPYAAGSSFDDYHPAYRTGYEGYGRNSGKQYNEVETDLQRDYEATAAAAKVPWEKAKHATRAAWDRVSNPEGRR